MQVLMISSDEKILRGDSAVAKRMVLYGSLVKTLHIIVFTKSRSRYAKIQLAENVFVYPTNSKHKIFYLFDAYRIGKTLSAIDLVSTQDPFEMGFLGVWLAKKHRVPLHTQIHTDICSPHFTTHSKKNNTRRLLATFVLRRCAGIRVVSERIKRSLITQYDIDEKKINVLPIFVDVSTIAKEKPSFDLHDRYPQFKTIILMVSRLEKEKNVSMALRVLSDVFKQHTDVGMIIVGQGRERARLGALARRLGIAKNVIFVGWQNDVVSYYKTADMLLVTSQYEGYGMVFVEAIIAQCPIVTTAVGIIGDVITSDMAFICPVGDIDCLINTLNRIIERPQMLHARVFKTHALRQQFLTQTQEAYLQNYKEDWERCL